MGEHAVDAWLECRRYAALTWCWWFLGTLPLYWVLLTHPHQHYLGVPVGGTAIAGTVCWVLWVRSSQEYRRLVGERFGVLVWPGDAPNLRDEEHFDSWCRAHGLGAGPVVTPRTVGPLGALATLGAMSAVVASICAIGLVVPGVPGWQRPGWAVALLGFALLGALLRRLAARRPTLLSRGEVRRILDRRSIPRPRVRVG